jgi:hypothetical protein
MEAEMEQYEFCAIAFDEGIGDEEIARSLVKLNENRDIPLLLHIRNATFISHDQLRRYAFSKGLEQDRRNFNWRVRRFVAGGFVRATPDLCPYVGKVYSITRLGLGILESYGEGLLSITSESRHLPSLLQAPHFLELDEIRAACEATGKLIQWRSEREMCSVNYAVGAPLAKDYDAVAEFDLVANKTLRVAIEYERTIKTAERYGEIEKTIREEGQIDLILYLTSTMDLVFSLSSNFNRPRVPMCFTSSRIFRANKMESRVVFIYGDMKDVSSSLDEAMQAIMQLDSLPR